LFQILAQINGARTWEDTYSTQAEAEDACREMNDIYKDTVPGLEGFIVQDEDTGQVLFTLKTQRGEPYDATI
jgi:hypothetical protein